MRLLPTNITVLQILADQSPGYLVAPSASSFLIEDLQPGDVEQVLQELLANGLVDHVVTSLMEVTETVTRDKDTGESHVLSIEQELIDDSGQPVVVDQGYAITDAGRQFLEQNS